MTPLFRQTRGFALLCLLAAGCAGPAMTGQQPDAAAFAARKAKAERLTRQGDLAEALVQWKVLETIAGHDPVLARKRRAVEADAKRQAAEYFDKGRAALAKRQVDRAYRDFVAVLALDPGHEGAITLLREIEAARVRSDRPKIASPMPRMPDGPRTAVANKPSPPAKASPPDKARSPAEANVSAKAGAAAKAESKPAPKRAEPGDPNSESLERAIALAKEGAYLESIPYYKSHLARYPKDAKASKLLAASQREVGIALYNSGKLQESLSHLEASLSYAGANDSVVQSAVADAKSRLAQRAYEKGVRVFRQDVAQAIALWEKALFYDPTHVRARANLDRAYKIQQSLNALTN